MKWMKKTGLAAVAVSILAVGASQAAAQSAYTPTVSASVNGNVVAIQWTPVAGAQQYNLVAGYTPTAPAISVNLPASITTISVTAPNGVYYVAVRAMAGPYAGPFSNVVEIAVPSGGGGCTPPPAPTAGAQVNGPVVNIGWDAIPGALGYQVQYSRTPGITELAHNVGGGTLGHQLYLPMLGTFYARVVVANSCGMATSNEVAFTITDLTGNGPRTPDPPPGQLLPMPSYGEAVSLQVAQANRGDLASACHSRTYLYKLVRELRKYDSRWGLNYKRGWHEMSHDIVTYNGTNEPDNGADHVYLVDVVHAICDSNGWNWDWHGTTMTTWGAAGSPECGTHWCAKWTLDPYLAAGYPLYPFDQR